MEGWKPWNKLLHLSRQSGDEFERAHQMYEEAERFRKWVESMGPMPCDSQSSPVTFSM